MQKLTKKEVDILTDAALVLAEVIKAKGSSSVVLMLDKFVDRNVKIYDDKRIKRQRTINFSLFHSEFILGDKMYA